MGGLGCGDVGLMVDADLLLLDERLVAAPWLGNWYLEMELV